MSFSRFLLCSSCLVISACHLSAQKQTQSAIVMQAQDDWVEQSEQEWPYPKPPEGWKGLEGSGMRCGGTETLQKQYNALSVIRVTLKNDTDAPVDVPLNSLADARVRSSRSELSAPAVGMRWKMRMGGNWLWWIAVGWDKPIAMILPGRAKAELRFFFPTSTPGDMFSLAAIGEVKIQKGQ